MRKPRSLLLNEDFGYIHKFWRCHNREFYLSNNKIKELYLDTSFDVLTLPEFSPFLNVHSFCMMDNHVHQQLSYSGGVSHLSNWMRRAHSRFGIYYNKLTKRSGKVACDRPKTPLIENSESCIRVHMYIEANPVRAKKLKVEQLKNYKYSSFGFYAFGKVSKYSKFLTIPDWYLDLGKTPSARQKKYRKIFYQYLKDSNVDGQWFLKSFIGSPNWIVDQQDLLKQLIKYKIDQSFFSNSS